jgi:hypothetical protein
VEGFEGVERRISREQGDLKLTIELTTDEKEVEAQGRYTHNRRSHQ